MLTRRVADLKKRLSAGEVTCGIWISIPSPTVCEIVADVGLDWVIVDAEHSMFNPETLIHMLMAFKASNTVPVIRVPTNDRAIIKQVLDTGWQGVIVPCIDTAEEAQSVVDTCFYPPLGDRGYGPRRVSNYYKNEDEYVKLANDSVICIIQAESKTAVDNIEEIVKVPGLDWVIVGPNDLSKTVGQFRDASNLELHKASKKILQAAQKQGLPAGIGNINIAESLSMGYQLLFLGEDIIFFRDALDEALKNFRNTVAKGKEL